MTENNVSKMNSKLIYGFFNIDFYRMGAGESKEKKPAPSARTVHGHGNGHGPSRWASNIWRSLKKSPRLRKKSKESQKSKKSSSDVSFMTSATA